MTLSQIRNRVQALQRRYGLPITVIRLRPYATQFCDQWAIAQDRKEPVPETHPFVIRKLADSGFHLTTFMPTLHHHLEETPRSQHLPPSQQHRRRPVAQTRKSRPIIDAVFQWDPPPHESVPIPVPSSPMLCFSPPFRSARAGAATV